MSSAGTAMIGVGVVLLTGFGGVVSGSAAGFDSIPNTTGDAFEAAPFDLKRGADSIGESSLGTLPARRSGVFGSVLAVQQIILTRSCDHGALSSSVQSDFKRTMAA